MAQQLPAPEIPQFPVTRDAPVNPPDPTWQSTQQQMAQHRAAPVIPPYPDPRDASVNPPDPTWQSTQQQMAQQQLERQAAQNRQLNQSNLNYQHQQMAQHRAAPVIPPDPAWQPPGAGRVAGGPTEEGTAAGDYLPWGGKKTLDEVLAEDKEKQLAQIERVKSGTGRRSSGYRKRPGDPDYVEPTYESALQRGEREEHEEKIDRMRRTTEGLLNEARTEKWGGLLPVKGARGKIVWMSPKDRKDYLAYLKKRGSPEEATRRQKIYEKMYAENQKRRLLALKRRNRTYNY